MWDLYVKDLETYAESHRVFQRSDSSTSFAMGDPEQLAPLSDKQRLKFGELRPKSVASKRDCLKSLSVACALLLSGAAGWGQHDAAIA
jgi:hypothetical protein